MSYEIRKVAVLGAGVMGQGIAAHLANAGIPSVLFDITPKGATDRRQIAKAGIANAQKLKPASFYKASDAARITPACYDDDSALLAECDWIVEVVVERLDIKRKVFQWVADNRKPGSIVSSNTSGIKLGDMVAEMDDELRQHFLVTHFFNPVRYMRLLELVEGPDTLPAVTEAIARFGERALGKGIVYGKDTPNFIANRVGTFGIVSVFERMQEFGLSVEAVDAVFGPAMGRPSSAVFRTLDLVGLDTMDHVMGNVRDNATEDEARERFVSPPFLKQMVAEGALGGKTGKGFYQKSKAGGKTVILARNLETGEYAPADKPRFASVGAARKKETVAEKVKAVIHGDDDAARFAWAVLADTLIYAANRIPEIADDIVNIDRGMEWGFAWDEGPFKTWDGIGVADSVARMEAEGREVTPWVKDMLAAGRASFYARAEDGTLTYWDPASRSAQPVPFSEGWLILAEKAARGAVVASNMSADLIDLGDGVACVSFRSKMNALDEDIFKMYDRALTELDQGQWEALVVGNQGGRAFSAGANIFMIAMLSMQQQWDQIDAVIRGMQDLLKRAQYSKKPVVTAPWGLTLGGGLEVAMQGSACQAAGELYCGLVEVGVGLIPGGGGCKEMLARYLGDIPEGTNYDPNPFVQQAFKNIALATVATSCEEARGYGYLRPGDRITTDPDALIQDAKSLALGLVKAGYAPPRPRRFKLPGPSGRAAIELFLYQMNEGGYATDHDVTVGKQLARVMTGGDIGANTWVDEQHVLDLEREAFLSLCGEQKTLERIQHMLTTGKPLRN
ncbi:MAG: 3-hydroxyacyl-CoA dehydrogenase/enoyl-CoA hydratase family protein [Alphaproteobacteria bacterium]|nr:3-hydroxyacyl-CoA dehydrogenase/enoyl-CoA hydratase family protein [Alphaproteobacteria bacterium]